LLASATYFFLPCSGLLLTLSLLWPFSPFPPRKIISPQPLFSPSITKKPLLHLPLLFLVEFSRHCPLGPIGDTFPHTLDIVAWPPFPQPRAQRPLFFPSPKATSFLPFQVPPQALCYPANLDILDSVFLHSLLRLRDFDDEGPSSRISDSPSLEMSFRDVFCEYLDEQGPHWAF